MWWRFWKDRITIGGSTQAGLQATDNQTYGVDLLINWGRFLIKNEWVLRVLGNGPGNPTNRRYAYVQPSYRLSDTLRLVYRFAWSDPDGTDNNRVEHMLGLNWVPTTLLRLRVEYSLIDFENKVDANGEQPDYGRVTTSVVISF